MSHTFESKYAWQLPHLPAVITTIAPFVIVQTSEQVDREEAADLIVSGGTVAVRLRNNELGRWAKDYAGRFPFDFTIRREVSNGIQTEAHKIMKGYGKWMFYGHVRDGDIIRWMFLSLDAFRRSFPTSDSYRGKTITNTDDGGVTKFVAFDVRKMPDDVLIGHSWPVDTRVPNDRGGSLGNIGVVYKEQIHLFE